MAKRQKRELIQSLKVQDYNLKDTAIPSAIIVSISDVKTKFDNDDEKSEVLAFKDESDDETKSVFINAKSINNLIDTFGDNDELWIGKKIKVVVEKNDFFNKNMFVVYPIK